MMRKRFFGLAAAAAAVLFTMIWFWPKPERPQVPVRAVVVMAPVDRGGLVADLVAPVEGLRALPLRVTGRASAGGKGALLQEWPGFHATARFRGDAVRVRFQDGANRWRVTLDQGRLGTIELARPGSKDLAIRGLPPGEHEIRVERISESSMPSSFGGIFTETDDAALPAPLPDGRLIEFIGDSDTVGFANTAQIRECSEDEVFAATDTSRSFGPQVAARLGADYRMVARSGIGLLRNYGGAKPETTMISRYAMALPSDPAATRLPQPAADIVVTGLGSNDFGSDFAPGEPWQDHAALSADFGPRLTAFLRDRVRDNPAALQVLLAFGEYGEPLVAPYRQAEAALRADGTRTVLVVLPKLERSACFWHPSADDHALIADRIVTAISQLGS